MASKLPELVIIRDTREKEGKGWFFQEEKRPGRMQIVNTVVEGLNAGDYAVKGYEDILRIERKNGFEELFGNLATREYRDRFYREMERLRSTVKHPFIIVESNVNNDVFSLGVPQMKAGLPGSRIFEYLLEIQLEFGIPTIFAGDAGKRVARMLIEKVIRKEIDGQ